MLNASFVKKDLKKLMNTSVHVVCNLNSKSKCHPFINGTTSERI